MNNRKFTLGFSSFVACLWLIVVATYGAQAKRDNDGLPPKPMQNGTSCSGDTSGGNDE